MDLEYVFYEQFDDIVKITINRPEVLNAISRRVYAELDEAFAKAEDDDEVKVIVVAGVGAHFGAGHDLGSQAMREELPDYPRDNSLLGRVRSMDRGVFWRLHDRWRNIGKPTIAMVQGYCIMGSWMLVASCDLCVASEDAKFADRSVRWGGAHHEYPTHFWELGIKKAKEYLWTGDFIDAAEAHRLGMVNRVVPRDKLEEATMWLARRVALKTPYALRVSKMSINQAADIMGQGAAVRASG
ncbi:MAG: enoyl-CoA hydratase-related protein, partial [Gammaproteobacteria bacterium]